MPDAGHASAGHASAAPRAVDVVRLMSALAFAAKAHANQRRKGAAQEPYVNHLIEVAAMVAEVTGGADEDALLAAILHDVVEDTPATLDELADAFGAEVARVVAENSDDMTLPKDERRRARIAAAPGKSPRGRLVKTADLISNLRAMASSPPAGWPTDRKLGYLDGCRALMDAARGPNPAIESLFDEAAAACERAIREDHAADVEGRARAIAQLDAAAGQPVHLIYLANTERRALGPVDVDRFCDRIARTFPSAVIQQAESIYEGARRPILMARIRTDSTEAIMALAQRLCLDFDQRFVGVEVGGRYVRVYADDTG
ncbi:HD domain-containing protein [Rubrimonas cliftonensis]|uniref:HD domain-containing protein n=1 Tax=Rubrimonas cliftonensis TaxID=89524 RepID=A0A1H4G2V4_9RHOB|nr:HD domain-containing protein [Rubrimonas cliftonensis]SEB03370.1 HD domain-containing protein [Rubrimonas cliftonensis]